MTDGPLQSSTQIQSAVTTPLYVAVCDQSMTDQLAESRPCQVHYKSIAVRHGAWNYLTGQIDACEHDVLGVMVKAAEGKIEALEEEDSCRCHFVWKC